MWRSTGGNNRETFVRLWVLFYGPDGAKFAQNPLAPDEIMLMKATQ